MAHVQYTHTELEIAWVNAGGPRASADLAAAVAQAESGGWEDAENHNTDGSIDRGPWQINSVHGALSVFPLNANARSAVIVSGHGANWHPWVTYNNGAYRKFLRGSAGPIPNPPSQPPRIVAGVPSLPPYPGATGAPAAGGESATDYAPVIVATARHLNDSMRHVHGLASIIRHLPGNG